MLTLIGVMTPEGTTFDKMSGFTDYIENDMWIWNKNIKQNNIYPGVYVRKICWLLLELWPL